LFRHIAVAIIDRLAAWMCCALNVLTSLFFSFLFLVVTSRFRLLASYTDEILDVDTSKFFSLFPEKISVACCAEQLFHFSRLRNISVESCH